MSENVKCTHIPRVRVEVDHEGMDMSWLECVVCGNRLYVSDEPIEALRTQLQEAQEWIDGYKLERESMIAVGREQANELAAAEERKNKAEALLKESKRYAKMFRMRCSVENCAACADALDLESRIAAFTQEKSNEK